MESVAVAFLVAAAVSCSAIKEDRTDCPAYVFLEGQGQSLLADEGDFAFMAYRGDSLMFFHWMSVAEFYGGEYIFPIDFGPVHFAGVAGCSPDQFRDGRLVIPYGSQCPESFAFQQQVIVDEDNYHLPEYLNPLFAKVFVHLEGIDEEYPYDIIFEGNIDGFYLPGLEPAEGAFACVPDYLSLGERVCRVPRQGKSRELLLSLYENHPLAHPLTKGFPKVIHAYSLPLGEYLADSGYDWYASELPDIHVTLDYGGLRFIIQVNDWIKIVLMDGHYVI